MDAKISMQKYDERNNVHNVKASLGKVLITKGTA